MSKKLFVRAIAGLFLLVFVVPAAFLIAPQRVSAQSSGGTVQCVAGLLGLGGTVTSLAAVPIQNVTIQTGTSFTAGATTGSCLYQAIIVPILRQMIRNLLQSITQATINWIKGGNGTGQPSFVQNLSTHLQGVGDAVANPFITQIATALNSPFGPTIASSLQTNYAQQTSMAGFYAANQCTLPGTTQSQQTFLAGTWPAQGGVAMWLSLTSPTPNNPYILNQNAVTQLGSNVGQAVTNRRQDLIQGQGFLSFCGGNTTTSGVNANVTGRGINPQVTCMDSNGNQVNATTPGSAISSYLQANVNSGIGQLVSAQDLDSALGQIANALMTSITGPSGLFGSPSLASVPNINSTVAAPSSAASSAISLAQTTLSNITTYDNTWQVIASAANVAANAATTLANFCTSAANTAALAVLNANATNGDVSYNPTPVSNPTQAELNSVQSPFISAARAQAVAAQAVPAAEIAPVLARAQAATSTAATTQAFALQVQAEATAVPIANPVQFSSDVATLVSMSPTAIDLANVQQNAQAYGGATASPAGSLTVSGGSLIDQMNLISTNAATLETTVCNPASLLYAAPATVSGG